MKQRIEFIDLAKGICILLVVFLHIACIFEKHIVGELFVLCRMPLYFTLSGIFFKTYENFKGFVLRKVNKLLIPFISFYFFFAVLMHNFYNCIKTHSLSFDWSTLYAFITESGYWDQPLWFLCCLFIMNIFFYSFFLIANLSKKHKDLWIVLLTLMGGGLGMFLGKLSINLPLYIDTALTALPFFSFGYVLRIYTTILTPNKYDKFIWLFIIVLFAICMLCPRHGIMFFTNEYEAPIITTYIGGWCGTLAILLLAKAIKYLPAISFFGRYSIIILLTHFPIRFYFVNLVLKLRLSDWYTIIIAFLLMMLSYLIIIPLFKKYLPYITAQKDIIPISTK